MTRWLIILASCFASAAPAENSRAGQVDATLRRLSDEGAFSGAVTVMRNGGVIYRRGFGLADVEKRIAFAPDTSVESGSMAKPFTAAAILTLVDEGRIKLDEPVRSSVPEFPHAGTTIRHLLTHSAGLPDYDYFQDMLDAGNPVSNVDLLKALGSRRTSPAFQPGTEFAYCNLCYDTLALVIERTTGESYADFIRNRFLVPGGARHSFIRPARFADWSGARTKGYRRVDGRWELNDAFDNEGFYGGANIYFSADDLAALLSVWAKPMGAVAKIHRLATIPVSIAGARSEIRLGSWYCDKQRVRCYYSGHHQGFHSFGYWDAKNQLAVAFTSNSTIDAGLQSGLPKYLISLAEGRALRSLDAEEVQSDLDWQQLAGFYRFGGIGKVSIEIDAEGATIRPENGARSRIYALGKGWFYVPGIDVYLSRPADQSSRVDLQWTSVFEQSKGRKLSRQPSDVADFDQPQSFTRIQTVGVTNNGNCRICAQVHHHLRRSAYDCWFHRHEDEEIGIVPSRKIHLSREQTSLSLSHVCR